MTLEGYRRQGLVHQSQVSEEVNFSQEDEDADKVAALEYFFPVAAQANFLPLPQVVMLQEGTSFRTF